MAWKGEEAKALGDNSYGGAVGTIAEYGGGHGGLRHGGAVFSTGGLCRDPVFGFAFALLAKTFSSPAKT